MLCANDECDRANGVRPATAPVADESAQDVDLPWLRAYMHHQIASDRWVVTAEQARDFARAAVLADRKARAALAGAPVAPAEVMDALNWVDDFIARCNRDDRGSCDSVNVLRRALAGAPVDDAGNWQQFRLRGSNETAEQIIERERMAYADLLQSVMDKRRERASDPVAGHQPYPAMPEPDVNHPGEQEDGYSRAAVETAMRAAHDRGYSVGWDHGKEHASAPVAGEAQPAAYLTLDEEGSPCMLFFDVAEARGYCALGDEPEPLFRHAAPQASADDVRNAALEEAATVAENSYADAHIRIRALKQPQADKDGGQQRAAFDHPVFAFLLGEGPLHDVHFGDRHPSERGAYWWRKDLRAALSATQTEQGERDAD